MPVLKIDGQEVEFNPGESVIQAWKFHVSATMTG